MSSSEGPFHALRTEYARVLRALEGLPMSLCSARCARTSVVAHLVLDLPWASSAVQAGFPAGCRFPAARVVGSALRRRLMAVHADRLRPSDDPGHARALAAAAVLRSIYERAAELLRTDWTESALRGPRQRNADGGFSTAPAATRTVHPVPPYGLDGGRRRPADLPPAGAPAPAASRRRTSPGGGSSADTPASAAARAAAAERAAQEQRRQAEAAAREAARQQAEARRQQQAARDAQRQRERDEAAAHARQRAEREAEQHEAETRRAADAARREAERTAAERHSARRVRRRRVRRQTQMRRMRS